MALEAFEASIFRSNYIGYKVNLRVNSEIGVFVIIVNS